MDWLANLPWWQMLICGALLGWLVEWIIDVFYWRKQLSQRDTKLVSVNKESTVLQSENARINDKLKTSRSEFNSVNTQLVARNEEYDDLTLRFEGNKRDLDGANTELDEYKIRVSSLDGQVVELRDKSLGHENELKDLQLKYTARDKEIEERDSMLSVLRGQLGELETSLSGFHAQIGDKDNEISRLSGLLGGKDAEIEGKHSELATLKAQLSDQSKQESKDNDRVGKIQSRLNTLEDENSNLRRTIAKRNNTIDELQNQLSTHEGELGDIRNSLGIGAGAGILGAISTRLSSKKSATNANENDKNIDGLVAEIERLKGEATTLEKEKEALQIQLDGASTGATASATGSSVDAADMENWLAVYGKATESLQAEVAEKESQLAVAEASLASIQKGEDLQPKVDELQFRVNTLDVENAALRKSLLSKKMSEGEGNTVITNFIPVESDSSENVPMLHGLVSDKESEIDDLNVKLADTIEVSRERATSIDQLNDENADLRAKLTSSKSTTAKGDDFTTIYGIGNIFQSRLYAAGILTYANLCDSKPEAVVAACETGVTVEEASYWIQDSCTLASGGTPADRTPAAQPKPVLPADQRDNLTKIKGIGKVFQGRLYDAGIYTWEQLAATDTDQITSIISPEAWQKLEPDSWRTQAAELARKKRQKGGIMPDDLKLIHGIGQVYEGKLNEAGIETFSVLAASSATRIKEIIDADELQKQQIEPSRWIIDASILAKKKQ